MTLRITELPEVLKIQEIADSSACARPGYEYVIYINYLSCTGYPELIIILYQITCSNHKFRLEFN